MLLSLSLLIAITIGQWIFHGPARVMERDNAFIARVNYRDYLLRGVMELPADWHTTHHSGDTIDRINKSSDAIYRYASSTFEVIETIIRFIGSYIALVYFNIHASYIVLLICIVTVTIILNIDRILIPQYHVLNRNENNVSAKIYDSISNITTIIIMRVDKIVGKSIFEKSMETHGLYNKNSKLNEMKWFLVSVLGSLMIVLILGSYILMEYSSRNTILIGNLFILYGYAFTINSLFYRFAYKYGEILVHKTSVINGEEISEDFNKRRLRTSTKLGNSWKELSLDSLSFSYETERGEKLHINNVSMKIRRGERIAFIGASGSGKTTMLKLMIDLYTPQQYTLKIDGQDIDGGFSRIHDDILLVPQDPELFNTTIRENITMGNGYTAQDILDASYAACFAAVAERLPNKYESSIMERGVNMSGGKKQRLALSRGILASKDKEIVLLDEPTSSVDSRNELQIYKNIFSKFKDKTIISSIHRLHLLPLFDKIYYFEDGKIIASGSFDDIMKNQKFRVAWKKYTSSGRLKNKK